LTPNIVHVYSVAVARHALTQRSKGEGHTVMKTVMVARFLVTRAAMAVCCCCRRGSACRFDCLCLLVVVVMLAGDSRGPRVADRFTDEERVTL